jgi:hypothetical protein
MYTPYNDADCSLYFWDNMKYKNTETKRKAKYSSLRGIKLEAAAEITLPTNEEFMTDPTK